MRLTCHIEQRISFPHIHIHTALNQYTQPYSFKICGNVKLAVQGSHYQYYAIQRVGFRNAGQPLRVCQHQFFMA